MKHLVRRTLGILAVCVLALGAVPARAQAICPASTVGGNGIGDGCTTDGLAYIPQIGAFRGTFTPACNNHDKCYTTLGASGGDCNIAFSSDMHSACQSDFNPLYRPEYPVCMNSAAAYRAAVDIYLSQANPLPTLHANALAVSRQLEAQIRSGACATTPERSTLYTAALIARVRNTFAAHAGRQPTLFEFFEVMNGGNYVYDAAAWENNLIAVAIRRASLPPPPPVGFGANSTTLSVTPVVSGAVYTWVIDGRGTVNGTSVQVTRPFATSAYWHKVRGYLKATLYAGTPHEISDVAIIDTSVFVRGTCAAPGQLCQ